MATAAPSLPPIGALLREWRSARRMSQLDLSLEAGISTRHLSYVETGKARAGRDTVARIADALAMPLRDRNALLHAAGYAASFPEQALTAPALDRVQRAIDLILAHQEPYPAFVISRHWEVLATNQAAMRIGTMMLPNHVSPHTNLIRQIFDPADLRQIIVNWTEVARRFIRHLHDDFAANPTDHRLRALLDEALAYPGVSQTWRLRDLDAVDDDPLVTFTFATPRGELRLFETITTFAAPRDVTVEEIRIDCTFPADEQTARICTELARSG